MGDPHLPVGDESEKKVRLQVIESTKFIMMSTITGSFARLVFQLLGGNNSMITEHPCFL